MGSLKIILFFFIILYYIQTYFDYHPEYGGDSNCYIFSLFPRFHNFYTWKGKGG